MEKISDLIPLLVIIVSLIFSFMGGGKKKKKQTSWQKTVPPTQIPVEEPVYEPVSFEPVRESRPVAEVFEKPVASSKKRKETPKRQNHNAYKHESETISDLSDADELRKAIIYSEILKRPEF